MRKPDSICSAVICENGIGPSGQPEPRLSLLFQLGGYRPEMTNLTRHYILCDDDIARHDLEKAYQHTHGIKPSDAGLVAGICKSAADCRSDQDCNGVSGSNIKACKPKP